MRVVCTLAEKSRSHFTSLNSYRVFGGAPLESDPDGESEVGPNLLRSGLLRPVLMFMLFPTFFLGLLNMGVYYSRQRTWLEIFLFGGLNILLALFMFWLLKRKDRLVLGLQPGGWCMALIVSFLGGAALMFLIERL